MPCYTADIAVAVLHSCYIHEFRNIQHVEVYIPQGYPCRWADNVQAWGMKLLMSWLNEYIVVIAGCTVKPVFYDHLYNEIYYLWFIQ